MATTQALNSLTENLARRGRAAAELVAFAAGLGHPRSSVPLPYPQSHQLRSLRRLFSLAARAHRRQRRRRGRHLPRPRSGAESGSRGVAGRCLPPLPRRRTRHHVRTGGPPSSRGDSRGLSRSARGARAARGSRGIHRLHHDRRGRGFHGGRDAAALSASDGPRCSRGTTESLRHGNGAGDELLGLVAPTSRRDAALAWSCRRTSSSAASSIGSPRFRSAPARMRWMPCGT